MKTAPVILLMLAPMAAQAQGDSTVHAFTLHGYVKYLDQASFQADPTQLLTGELIHNRLNFRYRPGTHLDFRLEVRNRIYYGELVQDYPGYAELVTSAAPTLVNLSRDWVNRNAVLINTTVDRASAEWTGGRWDLTLGRQRINWGISTVWTPNDIFNTFNYFDFDYEERPGTDAARVQYTLNSSSSLELALGPQTTIGQDVGALMYRMNRWAYDFQVFSGVYRRDLTAGIGWAGNLGNAGFKGEVTGFTPYGRKFQDTTALAATVSVDYSFKDGIYVLGSVLYNSMGQDTLPNLVQLTASSVSAKDLSPFRYALFGELSYPFSPIFKGSLGLMYSPSGNGLIGFPDLTYSIANNWDLDLISQSFFARQGKTYRALGNAVYLRIKWSF